MDNNVETRNIKMSGWVLLLSITLSSWVILSVLFFIFIVFPEQSSDYVPRATVNEGLENNTRNWKAYNATLASVGGGQSGKCLQITTNKDATGYAYIAIPTEVDKTYRVTASFKKGTSPNGQIKVGTERDAPNLFYSGVLSDDDWKEYSGVFVAPTTNTCITLVNLTSAKGLIALFDNVTLNQVEGR